MLSSMVNIMSRQPNCPIEAGELVRCRNMERWWVGKVIKTTEGSLLVSECGSNRRWKVLSSQAVPFAQFLKRLRRARKLKTVYAEFSDGVVLEHMPQRRLRSLFQRLRTYGIDFDDAKTRANDYFPMWTNRAHLFGRKRTNPTSASLPAEVTDWLPKWLVAEDLPPSSRDPLGLQADAGKLADSLLPGLNVFTNRVGYFFFLPWLLEQLNCSHGISLTRSGSRSSRGSWIVCDSLTASRRRGGCGAAPTAGRYAASDAAANFKCRTGSIWLCSATNGSKFSWVSSVADWGALRLRLSLPPISQMPSCSDKPLQTLNRTADN